MPPHAGWRQEAALYSLRPTNQVIGVSARAGAIYRLSSNAAIDGASPNARHKFAQFAELPASLSLTLRGTGFRPCRTGQFDSPHGAVLE
jgi:hypothetical protein